MSSASPTTVPSLTTYAEKPIFGLDFIALLKFFYIILQMCIICGLHQTDKSNYMVGTWMLMGNSLSLSLSRVKVYEYAQAFPPLSLSRPLSSSMRYYTPLELGMNKRDQTEKETSMSCLKTLDPVQWGTLNGITLTYSDHMILALSFNTV